MGNRSPNFLSFKVNEWDLMKDQLKDHLNINKGCASPFLVSEVNDNDVTYVPSDQNTCKII